MGPITKKKAKRRRRKAKKTVASDSEVEDDSTSKKKSKKSRKRKQPIEWSAATHSDLRWTKQPLKKRFRMGKSVTYKQQRARIAEVTDTKLLIRWNVADTTKPIEKWVSKTSKQIEY